MKIIVTGHKHHGKNSVCDMLSGVLKSIDSSRYACEEFLFERFQQMGILYDSVELCHQDRVNNRQLWYEEIRAWNGDDPARMGKAIFAEHDIYNGMRHIDELNANREQETFDALFWVDASERLPAESLDSMSITKEHADYAINNNGDEKDLSFQIYAAFHQWWDDLRDRQDRTPAISPEWRKMQKLRDEIMVVVEEMVRLHRQ